MLREHIFISNTRRYAEPYATLRRVEIMKADGLLVFFFLFCVGIPPFDLFELYERSSYSCCIIFHSM